MRHRKWNQGPVDPLEKTLDCGEYLRLVRGGAGRLAKDLEILTNTAENMIRIAMIKVTLAKCII